MKFTQKFSPFLPGETPSPAAWMPLTKARDGP